jgi:hypothetical protein
MSYFNLSDACAEPGCPVCRLLRTDAERALDALMYENANDPDSHREFRQGRGLCNTHGWQLARFAGYSLGTAILYRAAVNEVLAVLERTLNPTSPIQKLRRSANRATGAALAAALAPEAPCFVCKLLSVSEPTYLDTFAQYLGDDKLIAAYRASDGLCLPHFRGLLRRLDRLDGANTAAFLAIQQAIWGRLEAELREFADKARVERMTEAAGSEADSWRRAIGSLGGEPNIFGLTPRPPKSPG